MRGCIVPIPYRLLTVMPDTIWAASVCAILYPRVYIRISNNCNGPRLVSMIVGGRTSGGVDGAVVSGIGVRLRISLFRLVEIRRRSWSMSVRVASIGAVVVYVHNADPGNVYGNV